VLTAYDRTTGTPRWIGSTGGWGYSSPHLATIDGVAQIVLLNGAGAIGVAPSDGTLLWQHEWRGDGIVQPAVVARGDVLIGSGSGLSSGVGMRRVSVAHGPAVWTVEERWTSSGGRILSCIDLEDGTRQVEGRTLRPRPARPAARAGPAAGALGGRRAGARVGRLPDQFAELARIPAIEGKTWNHPVLAGDVLLVRNGEEMAAFRLPLASQ
jgi:outer membrane protein assembly factor BamB